MSNSENIIIKIAEEIKKVGGDSFYVGGYVRDKILGLSSKDIDIEVFGLSKSTLVGILKLFGKVDLVGSSFGVIKLTVGDESFDFSLPRIDSKIGNGHKGFIVEENKNLSIKEAAKRRDFTFNAMCQNILTKEIIDPFDGLKHIHEKRIVHTSCHFVEDPLRVLRAMQFAGRFDYTLDNETTIICKELKSEFDTLSKERIWIEFEKLLTKSIKPSRGIDVLQQTEWIEFFPEISKLDGLEQEPEYHPEGDVLTHTKFVIDEMSKLTNDISLMLAALCHDMGKITTTESIKGKVVSRKHAIEGVNIALDFMNRINTPKKIQDKVIELVREHMICVNTVNKRSVRRLLSRLKHITIDELMLIIEADHSGRPPLPKGLPDEAKKIKEISESLGNEVKPILMGRHLIGLGLIPGLQFGTILKIVFEAQLDGLFDTLDGAIDWYKRNKHEIK